MGGPRERHIDYLRTNSPLSKPQLAQKLTAGGLFPLEVTAADVPAIAGLSYLPGYLHEHEQRQLREAIEQAAWDTKWERRRQVYGESYGEEAEAVAPMPDWGLALAALMHREGIVDRPFDQMLVNEYLPGQGIALHCDYEPFDRTVVSLSLL